jgi:hypothetical protein
MNKQKPIEVITWVDAFGGDGWITKKEMEEATLRQFDTVGYVFNEDKNCVRLTMVCDEPNDHFGAYMVIPKGMIVKRKVILK